MQLTQKVEPEVAAQNSVIPTNENVDMYSKLINNKVLQQKTLLTNVQSDPNTLTPSQPSWNDPQIHISSASGKSVTGFLDICNFVQCTAEEEVVLGGQGDQQIIVKSGLKKPKLESLYPEPVVSCQFLSILYKLVGENKLVGSALMDSLSYTTKVYQLVQRFSLVSVLLFDREYRKLQASMGFRWGTDVQHLHTLFLQARSQPSAQASQQVKKGANANGQKPGKFNKDRKGKEICRNFNSSKGCSFSDCRFQHTCLLPGAPRSTLCKHTSMNEKTTRFKGWLVVLRLNVPFNNFSVMSGRSHRFLGN